METTASAAKAPTHLKRNDAVTVADGLNSALADCFALFLKTKNFHWHVSGPHFRDYHVLLDEQAAQIFAITDVIAERVRKIGSATLRSIGDVARRQTISDDDRVMVRSEEMLQELHQDNLRLVESFRAVKRAADDAGDNATSGLVDVWTDEAEQRAWFLFETTRKG